MQNATGMTKSALELKIIIPEKVLINKIFQDKKSHSNGFNGLLFIAPNINIAYNKIKLINTLKGLKTSISRINI